MGTVVDVKNSYYLIHFNCMKKWMGCIGSGQICAYTDHMRQRTKLIRTHHFTIFNKGGNQITPSSLLILGCIRHNHCNDCKIPTVHKLVLHHFHKIVSQLYTVINVAATPWHPFNIMKRGWVFSTQKIIWPFMKVSSFIA